ncbi:energy-coupling factor ABC transporter permease [Marinobacter caseinilyticus]|uniref:energy-coupling factor ABC transporter permease n=1 Tax=Marinobacter caseinilyticus TaxID=2692195 RepID=UPI00140CDD91|nr:energy-coupling factor ABC transporter permease [Marinobacter caseinilyticus]
MGMTENLLSSTQWILTTLLFAVLSVRAARTADWSRLKSDTALQHSFFGAAVALGFLWQLRAGVTPGLSIHVFGMTAVTLMLGWSLAVFVGVLASVMVVITGREPWLLLPANVLITVMIPALVTYAIMLWERHKAFENFFAYIFFCGFFGAGVSVAVAGCVMVLLLWSAGVYDWSELVHSYLRYLPLFMIPEGFVNGAVVTGFMVFNPERLLTLDPRRYR